MHGRKRVSLPKGDLLDEAELKRQAAASKKALLFSRLLAEVLANHKEKRYEAEAMEKSARLLEINPEVYSAWNYRKLAVQHHMKKAGEDATLKASIAESELRLVERALQKNYKAYGAWYHRKWVIQLGCGSLDREMKLIEKFLNADDRNFHGWDYRRFLVRQGPSGSPEKELEYTMEKINQNFSNYSAWHYRSYLLPQIDKGDSYKHDSEETRQWLTEEFDLIQQGLFTEPDDQSVWMYHSWLVGQTVPTALPSVIAVWPPPGTRLSMPTTTSKSEVLSNPFNGSTKNREREGGWWKAGLNPDNSSAVKLAWAPMLLAFNVPVAGLEKAVKVRISNRVGDHNGWTGCVWEGLGTRSGGSSRVWRGCVVLEGWNMSSKKEAPAQLDISEQVIGDSSGVWQIDVEVNQVKVHERCSPDDNVCGKPLQYSFYVDRASSAEEDVTVLAGGNNGRPWPEEVRLGKPVEGGWLSFCNFMEERKQSRTVCGSATGILGNDRRGANQDGSPDTAWWTETLTREIEVCRGLLDLEDSSKWTMLTLARLLQARGDEKDLKEVRHLLKHLMLVDPYHEGYYEDIHSQLAFEERLESSFESVEVEGYGFLSLRDYQLSSLGFHEQLLFIRNLDLSRNRLRSAQGLEALQLMTWLDLSHNQITHTSALSPLHSLPFLCELNLSHNLIGSPLHVDTCHYALKGSFTSNLYVRCSQHPPYSSPPPPPPPPPPPAEEQQEQDDCLQHSEIGFAVNLRCELPGSTCPSYGSGDCNQELGEADDSQGSREVLNILSGLCGLRINALNMFGNEVCELKGYRETLRHLLPCLLLLDQSNV
ncbi:hypothetical protein CBR_g19613 [Chara braunii]|uniref:Geranylgeranyl transferase type-2 subunit alpha n=1 Tax=Chara braunii TaxID=69332 RepID=A0A388KYF8_CHABU|nr:hypothetical protein CBR_g19613 [Chara braunii]|eukprot:GBG75100.1 hypothetical protein CBR_g19613 [Chara braunii]